MVIMYLYHGTIASFNTVVLRNSKCMLDFGRGFYTTSDINQARDMVVSNKFKAIELNPNESVHAYVYGFKFDVSLNKYLRVLKFNGASMAWLDYVLYNRTHLERFKTKDDSYDVVVGLIADARAQRIIERFKTIGDFSVAARKRLITELKVYTYTDQYVFKTTKAIAFLNDVCVKTCKEVF